MNPALANLLFSAQNIIHPQDGFSGFDIKDWMKLLDMDYGGEFPSVEDWVRVCSGLYKGDIGYVSDIKNWGEISLLLVPHLPLPDSLSRKRKQPGICANPDLFTIKTLFNLMRTHSITEFKQAEDGSSWSLLGHNFKHCLEHRTFHLCLVSLTSISLSSATFYYFLLCSHLEIVDATFPCPSEWIFSESEHIVVKSS